MRFVNIRELKLDTNKVLNLSKINGPVIITRRARPVALLRAIDEGDIDLKIGSLWKRLKVAAESAGYKAKDVKRLIKQVRRAKR